MLDANDLFRKMQESGSEWADLQSAANVLEDTTKSVLARLMMMSQASSVAAREMEALASNGYQEHIKATQEAKAKALKAKVRYEGIKVWIELRRDESATERAIMKAGG